MPLTVTERGIVRVVKTLYHLLLVRLVMFIPIVARFMSGHLSYKLKQVFCFRDSLYVWSKSVLINETFVRNLTHEFCLAMKENTVCVCVFKVSLRSVHTVRQWLRQRCRYQSDSTDVLQFIVLKCMVALPLLHRRRWEPIYLWHCCRSHTRVNKSI